MSLSINTVIGSLRHMAQGVFSGCYTPATLLQVSQSLMRMSCRGCTGVVIAAGSDLPRDWATLAVRGMHAEVQRIDLLPSPHQSLGSILIGIGEDHGFVLTATPIESHERDESLWLYDVLWSCHSDVLASVADLLGTLLPTDLYARIIALKAPPPDALMRLSSEILDFAARQHSTLGVANRSLTERMRNLEDQTRMIIHDMRAPLHTLLISIKALQRQRFDPEGQRELLDVARDSANYLLNLTESVLDSARLETSAWTLKRQPVRILNLVQSVCDPLELAARPDQARLQHSVAEDMPVVWIDRALMERVLTNLVTNAIKYTPAHGKIAVTAELAQEGQAIEVRVTDTGQGIPLEAQTHIFDRFYQANENDRRHGTGIGLYFCRLAVEAHGGTIGVESVVGEGSTFTLILPITLPEEV